MSELGADLYTKRVHVAAWPERWRWRHQVSDPLIEPLNLTLKLGNPLLLPIVHEHEGIDQPAKLLVRDLRADIEVAQVSFYLIDPAPNIRRGAFGSRRVGSQ